ncbi:MAG: hypothetical protein ACLUAM_04200 [Bifidobacterium adolescentis]
MVSRDLTNAIHGVNHTGAFRKPAQRIRERTVAFLVSVVFPCQNRLSGGTPIPSAREPSTHLSRFQWLGQFAVE